MTMTAESVNTKNRVIGKIVSIKDDTICVETGRAGDKSTITFKRTSVSEVLKPAPDTNAQYDDADYDNSQSEE